MMRGAATAISGPIVRKDAAERIVTAPVLIPNEPDRHRHQVPQENIEELATGFLPNGEIDAMHTGGAAGHPIENYVAEKALTFEDVDRTVPAGSWMLSVKVADDVWPGVVDGTYQGLSVFGPIRSIRDAEGNELDLMEVSAPVGQAGGTAPESAPALANSFASTGIQREILPAPVGTHWEVEFERATHVSIVNEPAVQAAQFVVAKSAGSSGGSQEQPVMDDEFKERFDKLQTAAEKSAEQAEAAAESAEEAQTAAEEAVEGSDGGGSGGGDGGSDALTEEGVRETVSESVAEALDESGGGSGGGSGSDEDSDIEDSDLDADTIEALTDAGAIDEETAEALGAPTSGTEKRLAAIEKSLEKLNGRGGAATQLDGVGEDDSPDISADRGGVSAALRGDGSGEDGDDE